MYNAKKHSGIGFASTFAKVNNKYHNLTHLGKFWTLSEFYFILNFSRLDMKNEPLDQVQKRKITSNSNRQVLPMVTLHTVLFLLQQVQLTPLIPSHGIFLKLQILVLCILAASIDFFTVDPFFVVLFATKQEQLQYVLFKNLI